MTPGSTIKLECRHCKNDFKFQCTSVHQLLKVKEIEKAIKDGWGER